MAAKKAIKRAVGKAKAKVKAVKAKAKRVAPRKPAKVSAIPAGFHTITPNLYFTNTAEALEFYKKAFGAKEKSRMPTPDGKGIWHAEMKIGDSVFFANDATPMDPGTAPSASVKPTAAFWLYVKDASSVYNNAIAAGASVLMPLSDQFWGDRMGMVKDPYGHCWGIAQHVKNMTAREMKEAGEQFAKQMVEQSRAEAGRGGEQPQPPGEGMGGGQTTSGAV